MRSIQPGVVDGSTQRACAGRDAKTVLAEVAQAAPTETFSLPFTPRDQLLKLGVMAKLKTVSTYSAGGVVLRQVAGKVQVVLVGQTAKGIWALPKGAPSKGESLEQTAARETAEETGLDVRVLKPIDSIDYWFVAGGKRFHKTVHYFLMEATGGDLSRHDVEYDRVEWVSLPDGYSRMSYPNEKAVVQKGVQLWTTLKK